MFAWIDYYAEFADKLLLLKNDRVRLLEIMKREYDNLGMNYPFTENDEPIGDICPFTIFGSFNKRIKDENRIAIMSAIGSRLGVKADVPQTFDGIPVLNNLRAWFFGYESDRKTDDISNLWALFEAALTFADDPSETSKSEFTRRYDLVSQQYGIKWNITMGLYWVRPYVYLNLDETNRKYLFEKENPLAEPLKAISSLKQLPQANEYLELVEVCNNYFKNEDALFHSFPELSAQAWKTKAFESEEKKLSSANFLKWFAPIIEALRKLGGEGTPEVVRKQIIADMALTDEIVNETRGKSKVKKFDNEVAFARNYLAYEGFIDKSERGLWKLTERGKTEPMDEEIASDIFYKWMEIHKERRERNEESATGDISENELRYWIYAPGESSRKWDEFYSRGIMGIGWDELGDLKQYPSKDAMKAKMKEVYGGDVSYKNSVHATWQFTNEMQPGDIVFAKKGLHKIIGRGIVQSSYFFDASRDEYQHLREIKWTHNGEWEHPGQAVSKTLTDITPYTNYVQKLENLFLDDETEIDEPEIIERKYSDYSDADFLVEVFMEPERYETLVNLLKNKKNVILQGAPGVGKTFVAKRLAYSIMGKRDTSRVMMVQFHQSYSYEDFIMGYRPVKDGFELAAGPFYEFCKNAQVDDENDYFFIIDEINRGNLSKIFGELLMLIENDKRGEKLRLLYANELFSVPKNVHIIGMMNTADRSLAMIDYALRRRFAFFDLEPAFDSVGFRALMVESANSKLEALVEEIKALNENISSDETLGEGFRVGHSYLCATEEVTDDWLMSVVEHEIIPLLNEYWFDERTKIEQWINRFYGVLND